MMEAEEEDAPDAEVTFALIAKRCLPADFLESADAQQEGLLHNRRLIGHTTKVNHKYRSVPVPVMSHNAIVLYTRSQDKG